MALSGEVCWEGENVEVGGWWDWRDGDEGAEKDCE